MPLFMEHRLRTLIICLFLLFLLNIVEWGFGYDDEIQESTITSEIEGLEGTEDLQEGSGEWARDRMGGDWHPVIGTGNTYDQLEEGSITFSFLIDFIVIGNNVEGMPDILVAILTFINGIFLAIGAYAAISFIYDVIKALPTT